MSVARGVLLALAVLATLLAAVAMLRLRPLARVYAVALVNVVGGGAVTLAGWLSEGPTPRTAKMLLICLVLMLAGATSPCHRPRNPPARRGAAVTLLVFLMLVIAAIAGSFVVLTRDPQLQVFAIAANDVVLGLLFFVLQAPDVALSRSRSRWRRWCGDWRARCRSSARHHRLWPHSQHAGAAVA